MKYFAPARSAVGISVIPPFIKKSFLRFAVLAASLFSSHLLIAAPATISLAGEWRFALDRGAEQLTPNPPRGPLLPLPPGTGIAEAWFKRDLPDRIQLPGILQAQGYGNEITPATPWVLTLGDAWWKLQSPALREHFSQPGKVAVPFLSQPPRHFLGAAWYQRDLDIPANWQGQRVSLFLERAHWETAVWLDEKTFPPNQSLVAPHHFDLGILAPGKHRLTIRVDNRRIIAEAGDNGHADDGHSVSDSLGASWNGIVGRIELQATSPVWIEDAQVFPNVAEKSVRLRVKLANAAGHAGSGRLVAGSTSTPVTWDTTGAQADIIVPLGTEAEPWDEFHPHLQHLTLTLSGDHADDRRELTFGLREVTHRDRELLINGHVVNLRTTHSGGDFPLTGFPAMDIEAWKKIIRTCQDFGMNGIRFHSWCPPEAAFTAADELGFYLQPECGLWSPFNPRSAYTKFLENETARLLQAFGNHPSFILLSPSNEPSGHYQQVTPQWAASWYLKDNRRLYSAGTGWSAPAQVNGGAQFATLVRYGGGQLRNVSGWFGQDFREAVATAHIPILAHEIGQWCAYPDFSVMEKFTGYLRPGNYHIFRHIAEEQGLLDSNRELAWASGRFQLACYKEEIEANLRTPNLAGYQLLDLHDYLGQGTALIGLLDAFWAPKSYVTAAEFHRFNSNTVPLARLTQRTFTTDETLETDVEIYHFAPGPNANALPYWKIINASGEMMIGGDWPARDIANGKNIPLGHVTAKLATLPAPGAYRLVVGLKNTPVENDWNFWLYPAQIATSTPEDVVVTSDWEKANARLSAGGKVLFIPLAAQLDATNNPPLKTLPVFWNIQMTVRPPRNPTPRFDAMLGLLCEAKHPALAGFPTETFCDWQWTALMDGVNSINLGTAPRELKPIVAAIDDWNRSWRLGVIFECKVGTGKLLMCAFNVEAPDANPGLRQLRRSLLDYMTTEKFSPTTALSSAQGAALWKVGAPAAATPTQRMLDPDLDDGSGRAPKRP